MGTLQGEAGRGNRFFRVTTITEKPVEETPAATKAGVPVICLNGYVDSLSECYFAGKGAALVLPPNERARPSRRVSAAGCDIQQHLQSMFYLLRPEETLKMYRRTKEAAHRPGIFHVGSSSSGLVCSGLVWSTNKWAKGDSHMFYVVCFILWGRVVEGNSNNNEVAADEKRVLPVVLCE
ncbi:hypothetical protein M0804_005971 [Polistes exclamans]|nr:hypothetical protein M0804_005971 [Polistes exclamans]